MASSADTTAHVMRYLASLADRYEAFLLHPFRARIERMRTDCRYGLRAFVAGWAFERAGSARGMRIAALKALQMAESDLTQVRAFYETVYHGKPNMGCNPALDPRLAALDIPQVIREVEAGRLADAYDHLALRGIGPKIRTFFIRDLVALTGAEPDIADGRDLVYCQPVDIWVRVTVDALGVPAPSPTFCPGSAHRERLGSADADVAGRMNSGAAMAGVSPIRLNQGVWYFCSQAVADEQRLRDLLALGQVSVLQAELDAVGEYLP